MGGIALIMGSWLIWPHFHKSTTPRNQYQTAQVEKGTLVISVSSAGQISSTNSRSVTTNVSGVVKNVFVKNGQTVATGQKIAEVTLDQDAQQTYTQSLASYQSAQNNLNSAKNNLYTLQAAMYGKWDTYTKLTANGSYSDPNSVNRTLPEFVIAQNEWLAAEAQYKNQQAVVTQAQTSLSSAAQSLRQSSPIITAPIAGTVSGLSLQKGSVITKQSSSSESTSTGQTIANITTDASPMVTINLTEIDVTKVKLNNKATIALDALPDKTFTGKVISIDTVGTVSSGVTSYPAVIAFDTDAENIYPNMSAQVSIITNTKGNVLLVPTSAVQTQNGVSSVRVLKNGTPESVEVETGLSSGTQTEIVSGLNEGDTIVTTSTALTTGRTTGAQTISPFSGLGGGGFGGARGGGGGRNVVRIGG